MLALFLLLAAVLVVLPTLRAAFPYDDTTIIRDNVTLRGWSSLLRAWGAPYWPTSGADASGLYRPLHVALLATVWNVAGGAPVAFHLYALALYCVVVMFVWRLLRLGVGTTAAAAGALLFATQPRDYVGEPLFGIKLALISAAIANALLLRRSPKWALGAVAATTTEPRPAWRVAAAASILLWLGAITAGRLIGYR